MAVAVGGAANTQPSVVGDEKRVNVSGLEGRSDAVDAASKRTEVAVVYEGQMVADKAQSGGGGLASSGVATPDTRHQRPEGA